MAETKITKMEKEYGEIVKVKLTCDIKLKFTVFQNENVKKKLLNQIKKLEDENEKLEYE
jgi:hypothetical protein